MSFKKRQVRRTLLIVGEGDSEVAFLKHVRQLYCSDGYGVSATVRNAHGKGPENVVNCVIRQSANYKLDAKSALLDTDILWTDQLRSKARKAKIDLIGSRPCFEGFLLSILDERPAQTSMECKKAIQRLLNADLTASRTYEKHFPKSVLELARQRVLELNQLLRTFEGF